MMLKYKLSLLFLCFIIAIVVFKTVAGCASGSGGVGEEGNIPIPRKDVPSFFAVHCEAGISQQNPSHLQFQNDMYPYLVDFVEMADRYNAKLTIMFNPQWAEYILQDSFKVQQIKHWQNNGHEIALHFHTVFHGDWCGYTNREEYEEHPLYRGNVNDMMMLLEQLSYPEKIITACCGVDQSINEPPVSNSPEDIIDIVDFPDEILYDVDGMRDGLAEPLEFYLNGKFRRHLRHHFLSPDEPESLNMIKQEYSKAKEGEVMGVVTHELDFARYPEFVENWFRYAQSEGISILTVKEIMRDRD